jgi:hypothetical protein
MSYQNPWFNPDGLIVPFGRDEGRPQQVGEFNELTDLHEVHAVLVLTDLPAFGTGIANQLILSESVRFPVGAIFQEVEMYTEIVPVGATADINFGLVAMDRTTEVDFNGLINAADIATFDTLGTIVKFGVNTDGVPAPTAGGALITGQIALTAPALLVASATTAQFTDGKVRVKIRYRVNKGSTQSGN